MIQIATKQTNIPSKLLIKRWFFLLSEHINVTENIITLRIVDSDESQMLNKRFRNIDKPTNVLSFNANFPDITDDSNYLGDIILCAPVVANEAKQQQKSLKAHWAHMLVHGCLHLLGYDHQTDEQAKTMETLEISLLKILDYDDPYAQ